jgi:hypothetical protein
MSIFFCIPTIGESVGGLNGPLVPASTSETNGIDWFSTSDVEGIDGGTIDA